MWEATTCAGCGIPISAKTDRITIGGAEDES
jgi:hypothetical protein